MSGEIQFSHSDYTGTHPLYFVAHTVADDQYINATSLEAYNATDWPQYAFPLTLDTTSGLYMADFPAVPDGLYFVTIYEQLGTTAATTDNDLAEGEYQQLIEPAEFMPQMQMDASGFICEFAEPITYLSYDSSPTPQLVGTYYINAVINRNPPAAVQEDGKVLADDIEICIANNADIGVTTINPRRDKIICSGRYGGAVKTHGVTLIASGDAGIWTLRVK